MRALTDTELMRIWERGGGCRSAVRALVILSEVDADASPDEFSSLPIGARDRRLLALREAIRIGRRQPRAERARVHRERGVQVRVAEEGPARKVAP